MATTTAAKAASKTTQPKKKDDKPKVFEAPSFVWNITDDPDRDRPFAVMTIPLGAVLDLVYVRPYDYEKSAGWQRDVTESHVANLAKAVLEDEYSPTAWKAGIEEWHEQRLKFGEPEMPGEPTRPVQITYSDQNRLPLTDANHRRRALVKILQEAQEDEDSALVARLKRQPVTIEISLRSKYLVQDFLNYQKGKAVSKSLIKSMEIAAGDYDEKRLPLVRHATDAVKLLAKDPRSHLGNFVTFDKAASNKVQYASMIADNSSSLATTLYGGSKVAMHFGKPPEWLARKQVESYQALLEYADPEDEDNPESFRRILTPGYALSPISNGGTRYGSHMLVMIGNCFAYRQAVLDGDDEPIEEERRRVAEVATKVFDKELEGADVQTKRRETAAFCKAYFSDMTRKEKPLVRPDGTPFDKVDGFPAELVEILSPSTLGVDKARWKAYLSQKEGKQPSKKRTKTKNETPEE